MMLILVLLQLIVAVYASVVFEDCGSAYELQAVNIQGCGMRLPCLITLGEDVPVKLEFKAAFQSSKLDQNVVLNINHVDLRTNVTPGSAYELQAVNIQGCGMRLPCLITLGEDVPVKLEFKAAFQSSKLDQNVVLNINHVDLRTNVTPELCDSVVCPVQTNAMTYFNSVMTIPNNVALNQRGYLRWRIYNERGVLVLCYSTVVQTQSRLQKLLRANSSLQDPIG